MAEPVTSGSRRTDLVAGLILAALLILLVGAEILGAEARPVASEPAWQRHLRALDTSIGSGDGRAATAALDRAWLAARASRRWEAMLAVGDATLQLGQRLGAGDAARPLARRAYLVALMYARDTGALDGVLAACQAFLDLGDRGVAAQCLRIADRLAARSGQQEAPARVRALANQLDEPLAVGGHHRVGP